MGKLKKIVKSDAFKIVVLVILCSFLIGLPCGIRLYFYQQEISQADKKLQEYTKQIAEDARKMPGRCQKREKLQRN